MYRFTLVLSSVVLLGLLTLGGLGAPSLTANVQPPPPDKDKKPQKPDLTIQLVSYPKTVHPGQPLGAQIVVKAKSTFGNPLDNVAVDIILTKNPVYPSPAPFANYSPNYADGVLLKGGREHIDFVGPGVVLVKMNGSNTIPADTPPGMYLLGVVIDAGNKVGEGNENNNFAFAKILVVK